MPNNGKVHEETNIQKDLKKLQVRNDIKNVECFDKNHKYYHKWKGLGLVNKEFKYEPTITIIGRNDILGNTCNI
jgi:hypothetical protein